MKFKTLITIILSGFLLSACNLIDKNDDNNSMKGLVSFRNKPVYSNGQISFIVSVQFGFKGKEVEVEYELLEGDTKITSGKTNCNTDLSGLGIFWTSPVVFVPVNQATYKGKTLTVFLDPSNKVTESTLTSALYVDSYKKGDVVIP